MNLSAINVKTRINSYGVFFYHHFGIECSRLKEVHKTTTKKKMLKFSVPTVTQRNK